jgi:hypothetical protein
MLLNNFQILLVLIIVFLVWKLYHSNEEFRLTKELVDKYLPLKQAELMKSHNPEAVGYCSDLTKLALKWSPDEKEVPTIQDKPFPCGNTINKCIIKTEAKLKEGKPLSPKPDLSQYLKD